MSSANNMNFKQVEFIDSKVRGVYGPLLETI